MNVYRFVVFPALAVILLSQLCHGCPRRRRSPRCYPRNCVVSSWGRWSSCSATCGSYGRKTRNRRVITSASCGGSCHYSTSQSTSCPGTCCPIRCSYSWASWGPCSATCQYGTRSRRISIWRYPRCGGTSCPRSPQTQRCGNGRYCCT